ncbi:MAG: DUF1735 domain-containing protein, partial [Bacteroidales bacterium]|nr:DUF1735 domain-containing protein [Bacteroidales bacterium]
MKKHIIIGIVSAAIIAAVCGACKFDDQEVSYSYTSVLFPNRDYNRNLIVGEGLRLSAGIIFAGVVTNDRDRTVQYVIDPSLIIDAGQSPLPPAYYTCGHASQIVVPAGQLKGYLPVEMDSAAFLSDPKSLTGEYILPLRLVSSDDVDSISPDLNFIRISVSYYAKQHGNYTYSGSVSRTKSGTAKDTTYQNIASENDGVRFLKTVGAAQFLMTADPKNNYDPVKADGVSFLLDVPVHGGGAVSITADPASSVAVTPDGTSEYDAANKTFRLNYKYT